MKTPFTDSCLCGAIRHECAAETIVMGNCHCRDCQQATGSAFAPVMLVPCTAVKTVGDVKYYEVMGDSGNTVSRGFCPNCGSWLFSKPSMPGLMSITAGSLDDPTEFQPSMDICTASTQPWDYMNPDLPKFTKLPSPK